MVIVQWIGVALTLVGLIWTGVREYPQVRRDYMDQVQSVPRFVYTTINIAYDIDAGKHWYQHIDGQWRDFPPKP